MTDEQKIVIYLAIAILSVDAATLGWGVLGGGWRFMTALFTPTTPRLRLSLPASLPVTLSYSSEGLLMASFQCPDDQQFKLGVQFLDSKKNPTQAFNQKWVSSDPTVLTVTDDGDGTCTVAGVKPGTAQVQLSATGKADGSDPITVTPFEVQVVGGEAVSATFQPGPLTPQSPAPAPTPAPAS
jgi:hypothetical protein